MENQTKVRNIKSLMRDMKKGLYNMEHPVQRKSEMWSKSSKELLFDSINKNIAILPIVFAVKNDTIFVVDGKQRLSILDEYINKKDTKLKFDGLKFDELDEDTKDKILSAEITTITYSGVSDEEIFELFTRYNNGVALSGDQKLKGAASMEVLDIIQELLNNSFFEHVNFTKGQLLKGEDVTVVLQTLMILSKFEFKNFSFKEIERFLEETDIETIKDVAKQMSICLENLNSFIDKKYKNLKKIHLPMIISAADGSDRYRDFLLDFLENYESKDFYRQHCQGSTSQKENVMGRINYIHNCGEV